MTVAELIDALRAMPQDALVVTAGFDECGYADIVEPFPISLDLLVIKTGQGDYHDIAEAGGTPAAVIDWMNPLEP